MTVSDRQKLRRRLRSAEARAARLQRIQFPSRDQSREYSYAVSIAAGLRQAVADAG